MPPLTGPTPFASLRGPSIFAGILSGILNGVQIRRQRQQQDVENQMQQQRLDIQEGMRRRQAQQLEEQRLAGEREIAEKTITPQVFADVRAGLQGMPPPTAQLREEGLKREAEERRLAGQKELIGFREEEKDIRKKKVPTPTQKTKELATRLKAYQDIAKSEGLIGPYKINDLEFRYPGLIARAVKTAFESEEDPARTVTDSVAVVESVSGEWIAELEGTNEGVALKQAGIPTDQPLWVGKTVNLALGTEYDEDQPIDIEDLAILFASRGKLDEGFAEFLATLRKMVPQLDEFERDRMRRRSAISEQMGLGIKTGLGAGRVFPLR